MSLGAPFTIVMDHNNLRYFTKIQRLNERQMRWQILLSRFNFELVYRPGSQDFRLNALSRRPQDMPKDKYDDRLTYRDRILLPQAPHNGLKDPPFPSKIQIASMIASPALTTMKNSGTSGWKMKPKTIVIPVLSKLLSTISGRSREI